jgi:SAM-dependent methyltransferase
MTLELFCSTVDAVDDELRSRLERSGYDRAGFAADYDRYRPRPPSVLLELLPSLAGGRVGLVVDLGSGTGLSTRPWAEVSDQVVGVEPNDAMREYAKRESRLANLQYVAASSYATGLAAQSVDIVTAAQSLQWMRPKELFLEVARILRPGGVFCAYDYFVFQTPVWEAAAAFDFVQERKKELRARLGFDEALARAPTLDSLRESQAFRDVRELVVHSVEEGDGDRLVGFALSEGSMRTLLEAGSTETAVGLDRLRIAAASMPEPVPWWIGYQVWLGRK